MSRPPAKPPTPPPCTRCNGPLWLVTRRCANNCRTKPTATAPKEKP
ncbi:hypothetical protein GCM10010124_25920 [Pilimelia terevasa]|uniref:Uncharacterized protein n=1 Tax=Pilimelia terevasa TaxID=53372 RepID=A0A8J3BR00_9ACTN|nr:hypothetical protein [Pilimelia terevasa]GGK31966.1 hypothetical protein GCM10010124_25920 [Pilimelia terevasa]